MHSRPICRPLCRPATRPTRAAIVAAALVICGPAPAQPVPASAPPVPPEFTSCLTRLKPDAAARGIRPATWETHTAGLVPDMTVIASLDAQPEFVTPIWDYLAGLVDDERVADGRAALTQWRDVLAAVEDRFGVDPATVVAVWGVESNFGRNAGRRPLLQSLSTLSCFGRRQPYFRGELFSTLKILQDGDVAAERLTGSWAGAFGQTQFMPSTYLRLAVDFDGDGRRDLIDSVPDALASTANFLKEAGWRSGRPWGMEVRLPNRFDAAGTGRRQRQPLSAWAARGVTRIGGAPLVGEAPWTADAATALLLPAGPDGPAFVLTPNFNALYAYNASESYALAIAHLSDRLRGGGPFATAWPTDDPGLSRAERRALQTLLIAEGHDIGEADGVIGARTRAALKAALAARGIDSPDGRAGRKALEALEAPQQRPRQGESAAPGAQGAR